MTHTKLRDVLAKVYDAYFRLHPNQRLYVNTVVALVLFLVASTFLGVHGARGFLAIFLLFWVAAILLDLVGLYKKVYESILGKALLLLLFSLCTNVAISLSSQVVNSIVGVDPTKFPHTITLLSILSIPFFVALGFGVLYFVLLILTPLLLMFHTLPDEKAKEVLVPGYSAGLPIPYKKSTRFVQFVSFVLFAGVVFSLSQKVNQSYESFLTETARSFLYHFEMYSKVPCVIDPGSRAAFLSDEKLLTAKKTAAGLVFIVRECKSGGA
jgi:hypothetical protein